MIASFQWLPNLVLLVGLTNGYMVTVDFGALIKLQQSHKLPDRVSAMGTSRVFNEYLQDVSAFYTASTGQRVACCGDTMVKIVHRTGVELEARAPEASSPGGPRGSTVLRSPGTPSSSTALPCAFRDPRPRAACLFQRRCIWRSTSTGSQSSASTWTRSIGTTRPRLLRARRPTATSTSMSSSIDRARPRQHGNPAGGVRLDGGVGCVSVARGRWAHAAAQSCEPCRVPVT